MSTHETFWHIWKKSVESKHLPKSPQKYNTTKEKAMQKSAGIMQIQQP